MPFANAVMAAQHAGWSMKLDVSSRSVTTLHYKFQFSVRRPEELRKLAFLENSSV